MFKVNQLVKGLNTGRYYTVLFEIEKGAYALSRMDGSLTAAPEDLLRPIGNNYQAKPKCSR